MVPFSRCFLYLLLFVWCCLNPFALRAQRSIQVPVYYINEKGDLYINQQVGYSFLLVPENNAVTNGFFVNPENGKKVSVLPEGKHRFGFQLANGEQVARTVYVDGTAPVTKTEFAGAKKYNQGKTIFYGPNLMVSLPSSDALSGTGQTFYSLNNGAEYVWDKPISGFTKNEEMELRFYSVDQVGNVEKAQTAFFTVDVSSPVVSVTVSGQQKSTALNTSSELVLSATDNLSGVHAIKVAFNKKSNFSMYLNPLPVSGLNEGDNTVYFLATDQVGNSTDTLSFSFRLDSHPPELSYEIGQPHYLRENIYYITSATPVKLMAEDAISGINQIRYAINGENETVYTQAVRVAGENTSYLLSYFSVDNLGNTANPDMVKLFLDMNPPVTTHSFSLSYFKDQSLFVLQKGTKIKLESTDLESGIKVVYFRKKGDDFKPYIKEIELTQTGLVTFEFFAEDFTGNTEVIQQLDIKVTEKQSGASSENLNRLSSSEVLRVIPAKTEEQNVIKAGKLPLYFWISDSPADTARKFLIGAKETMTDFSISEGKNSRNLLTVKSDGYVASYVYEADATVPVTKISTSGATETEKAGIRIFSGGLEVTLTATDNLSGIEKTIVSIDNAPAQEYKSPLKLFINEKPYRIQYYSIDKTGNVEPVKSLEFQVDLTAPKTAAKVLSNFSGNTFSPQTQIRIEADDNLSGVKQTYFRFNKQEFKLYTQVLTLSEFTSVLESANTLEFYSIDNTGNKEAPKKITFKFDDAKPEVSVVFKGTFIAQNETVFAADDVTFFYKNINPQKELRSVKYKMDNEPAVALESAVRLKDERRFQLTLLLEDILGNKSSTKPITVIPDFTSPKSDVNLSGLFMKNGETMLVGPQSKLEIKATDALSGVTDVYFKMGNQSFQRFKEPVVPQVNGKVSLQWYAVDKLGNKESVREMLIESDIEKPQLTVSVNGVAVKPEQNQLSLTAQSVITIAARDAQTEINSIEYQLNSERFLPYLRALTGFSATESNVLTVRVTDLLGNETVKTFQLTVIE